MYLSIHFNNDTSSMAVKVDDISLDYLLSTKVQSLQAIGAKMLP